MTDFEKAMEAFKANNELTQECAKRHAEHELEAAIAYRKTLTHELSCLVRARAPKARRDSVKMQLDAAVTRINKAREVLAGFER
jgi:hypothetical protein